MFYLKRDDNLYGDYGIIRDKWYKRLVTRIKNWFRRQKNRRANKWDNDLMKEFRYDLGVNKSAEDIPRKSMKVDEVVEDKVVEDKVALVEGELSQVTNEAWKGDSQLMVNGSYSRFRMASGFLEKYRVTSTIGQGSFGFVLKAERSRDSREVAIKFIYKQNINPANWLFDSELGMIPSEVFYLKSLNHVGIVQFLEYFDDGRYVYLVTELFGTSWNPAINSKLTLKKNPGIKIGPLGDTKNAPFDLFECIEAHKSLPEATIHFIFKQFLDIVAYLSSQGIVHRDLKDENVVVDEAYRIKIVDFGCAARIPWIGFGSDREEGWFEKFNGTLAFAPPEVIKSQKYRGSEAEMWTLGVLLYTMSFRQAPFQDAQSILYGQLEFPFEEDCPGVLDLMRKLLCKNPQNRIKLKELQAHPWIVKGVFK